MKYVEITAEQHDVLFELGAPVFWRIEHSEPTKRAGTMWDSNVSASILLKSVADVYPNLKLLIYHFYTKVDSDD